MALDKGVFAGLIEDQAVGTVTQAFLSAIARSYVVDGQRVGRTPLLTQSETRRRFAICADIFKTLRGDLKWGIQRIVDHLPEYLRAELDGKSWQPEKRECWIPGDGQL